MELQSDREITMEQERDLEIVGLHASTNGRSCSVHTYCGQHVKVGDLLRLVKCVVTINGYTQEAVKCVRIVDGTDSCHVAFVPIPFARSAKITSKLGDFVYVLELYDKPDSAYKRSKSATKKGMAACIFLDSIPQAE
jgi:hypothetical protein